MKIWRSRGRLHVEVPPFERGPVHPSPSPAGCTWPKVFTVRGNPVGYVRQTQRDRFQLRPSVVRYRAWCDEIRWAAGWRTKQVFERAMTVNIVAYLQVPCGRGWTPTRIEAVRGEPCTRAPDADNLEKAVLDALFMDDRLVWSLAIEKRFDDGQGPRLEVRLE